MDVLCRRKGRRKHARNCGGTANALTVMHPYTGLQETIGMMSSAGPEARELFQLACITACSAASSQEGRAAGQQRPRSHAHLRALAAAPLSRRPAPVITCKIPGHKL